LTDKLGDAFKPKGAASGINIALAQDIQIIND